MISVKKISKKYNNNYSSIIINYIYLLSNIKKNKKREKYI